MKAVLNNSGATIVLVLQLLQSGSCIQLQNRHPSYLGQVQYKATFPGVLNLHQSTLQLPPYGRFYQEPPFLQNVQESLPSENQLLYFGFPPNYANLPLVHAENPNMADTFYTPMPPFSIPEELLIQSQNIQNLHQLTTEPPTKYDSMFQMMEPFHYSTPNQYRTIIPVQYNNHHISNHKKLENKHRNGMQPQQYLKEVVKQNNTHPRYQEHRPMNYRNQKPYKNNRNVLNQNQIKKPVNHQNGEQTEIATKQQLYSSQRQKPLGSRNPGKLQHHSMLMTPMILDKMRNPSMKLSNSQNKANTRSRLNMYPIKPIMPAIPGIYPNTKGGLMDSQDKPIPIQKTRIIKMPYPYQQTGIRPTIPAHADFGEPLNRKPITKQKKIVEPVKEDEDSIDDDQEQDDYEDNPEENIGEGEEPRPKVEHTFVKTDKNANYKWGVRLQLN